MHDYAVTLAVDRRAHTLSRGLIAALRDAAGGGRVTTLADGEAVDIECATVPGEAALEQAVGPAPVDVIVTRAAGRRKKVLIADMDSTIVAGETLDELAVFAGKGEAIAAITRRSMNGELDFATALRERVAMLRGLGLGALEATWAATTTSEGAIELVATMRAHGAITALVSGGFTFFTSRVAARLGFDLHRANTLLDDGSALTGEVGEPILDRDAKLSALQELAQSKGIALAETLAIGDGANDLAMIGAAGLGIAYRAKPIVAQAARARIKHSTLRTALFAQGFSEAQFQAS